MTDHKARTHALLSASGAHRWMHCTPSALLEAQFPDTASEAASEGTLAHEIAEVKLRHYVDTINFGKRKLNAALSKLRKKPLYLPEMETYTDDYIDFIRHAGCAYEFMPFVQIEQKLDLTEYVPEGFGTADCIMIGGNVLHIIDFKYGKGVPVSAENNEQLQLYALGAVKAYEMLYKIDAVTMSIVQPRIDNTNSWTASTGNLKKFGETVKERAALAIKGEGVYLPGDWCRFCRARHQCRARADKNIELAFDVGKKPPLITNVEVGEYLRKGEDVAKWLSELQDYALAECLAGRDVAGYKAVEGRGSRAWTDMDAAFEAIIEDGTDEAMLYERKPLTLAQVEKLMGKGHFFDVAGEFVVKNPGKPTLVPSTDKRQAITNKVSANEAFK